MHLKPGTGTWVIASRFATNHSRPSRDSVEVARGQVNRMEERPHRVGGILTRRIFFSSVYELLSSLRGISYLRFLLRDPASCAVLSDRSTPCRLAD